MRLRDVTLTYATIICSRTRKLLELQDSVAAVNMSKDITQIIALKEENKDLKRKLKASSDSLLQLQLEEKVSLVEFDQ